MACCLFLALLITFTTLAAGSPLHGQRFKRYSSTHQVVEVPVSTFAGDMLGKETERYDQRTPSIAQPKQPNLHVEAKTSSDNDHNYISQTSTSKTKQLFKSKDQLKKRPSTSRKGQTRGKKSNTELLHHLGMTKLRSPVINHHRKRLASQSRKTHNQKSNSDSKMFVIKLPPNPYYYAHHDLETVQPQPKSVNNVPVNFNTNGKPSKVYHWNIPVLKKMVARKAGSSPKSAVFADSDIFNIDKQATWNETDDDKSIYRKATYYGPKKQSKHTFRKYFAGNGKPHSFYVMEKSKKPAAVYRLLP